MGDPQAYFANQAPNVAVRAADFSPPALGVTLQLGNVLLLLAALGVICSWTPHADTARAFLTAIAFADYGHIYAAYRALGPEAFWDVGGWNGMIWGNVGASVVLNVVRWLTVLGAFGGPAARGAAPSKKAQ